MTASGTVNNDESNIDEYKSRPLILINHTNVVLVEKLTEPLLIQLADGSTLQSTHFIDMTLRIVGKRTKARAYLMNLPPGFDVLIGME